MRRILLYITISILLNACSLNHNEPKPNVIIILTDDQGWGDVGFHGNEMINTPSLDKLAKNSIVFDRFYMSPVCAPTRASLLTGRDHLKTGVTWVTHRKEVMRENEITIGEVFRKANYHTAYYGKWHNGTQYPNTPLGQGFERFFGFLGGHINNYFNPILSTGYNDIQTEGYIANIFTDSVINYIESQTEPYMLYLAYNTPHTPYQVEDKYYNKYIKKGLDKKTATIYGMCENIDYNVGRIVSKLKELKQFDNTIFVYASDNGPNYLRYNGGFKGRKAQVDEGGIRVPCIMSYPNGGFKSRIIKDEMVTHIDILPTLMSLCGIVRTDLDLDGIDVSDILKNPKKKLADRAFFSHHVIRKFDTIPGAVRTNEYLLTIYPWDTNLYNLHNDPYQKHDISNQQPEIYNSLLQKYHQWFVESTKLGIDPEPIQLGHKVATRILFPAHEATLCNNTVFAGGEGWANDWIIGWKDSKDKVYWDVDVKNKASYQVTLKYACGNGDVGKRLKFSLGSTSIIREITKVEKAPVIPNHDRVKRSEVEARKWGKMDFGTIEVTPGLSTASIEFIGNGESEIQIKDIILNEITTTHADELRK